MKCQSGTRRIVFKDGVLSAGDAAYCIKERCREEVNNTQISAVTKGRRGRPRQSLICRLNFLAALNDPNRPTSRSERAVSL